MMTAQDRKALGRAAMTAAEASQKAQDKLEGEREDEICRYLTLRGVQTILRARRDKRTRNKKGQPDLIFAFCGFPMAWELKTDTGELSEDQEKVRKTMIADRWLWFLVRSTEQAKAILDQIEENQKPIPSETLPNRAGFYWWRPGPGFDYRAVQIVRVGEHHLMTYDVEFHHWGGRSIASWQEYDAIGQWIPVAKP